MSYNNVWLSLKRARMIAKDLLKKFKGRVVHDYDYDHIVEAMWNHPLYEDQMWLDVDCNDHDQVVDIHVGIAGGFII